MLHSQPHPDPQFMKYGVDPCYHLFRLDLFLSRINPQWSRTRWQAFIRKGCVFVNDTLVLDPSERVMQGQVCEVAELPKAEPSTLVPHAMALTVCYEDEDILVLDKPAGLVVHPGAGNHEKTLVHGLLAHCTDLSGISGIQKPGIIHRLDKDTSGLMVIAKNDGAHHNLCHQFMERSVTKRYWAFLSGLLKPSFGKVETLIARDPRNRQRQAVVSQQGKIALTGYRTLKTSGSTSLVECRLYTGRTHQIRVHCAHLGHPLLGDVIYGSGKGHSRQALHARFLGFKHPKTQQELSFESPLPPDLEALYQEHFHAPSF